MGDFLGDLFKGIGDWATGGSYSAEDALKKQITEEGRIYDKIKADLKLNKDQMITDTQLNIAARKGLIDDNALNTAKAYNKRVNEAVGIVTGGKASNVSQVNQLFKDNTGNVATVFKSVNKIMDDSATKGIDLLSDAGKQYASDLKTTLGDSLGKLDSSTILSTTKLESALKSATAQLEQAKGGYQAYTNLGAQATKDYQDLISGKYKMEESPAAKYALEKGLKSQSRLQRAKGQRVSNMGQSQEAELRSGVAAQDYQNKITNVMNAMNTGLNTINAQSQLSQDIANKQNNLGATLADLIFRAGTLGTDYTSRAGQLIAQNNQDIQKSIFDVKSNLAVNQANNALNEGTLSRSEYDKITQGIVNENVAETNALLGLKGNQQAFETNLEAGRGAQTLANTIQGQDQALGIKDAYNTNMLNTEKARSGQLVQNEKDWGELFGSRNAAIGNKIQSGITSAITAGGGDIFKIGMDFAKGAITGQTGSSGGSVAGSSGQTSNYQSTNLFGGGSNRSSGGSSSLVPQLNINKPMIGGFTPQAQPESFIQQQANNPNVKGKAISSSTGTKKNASPFDNLNESDLDSYLYGTLKNKAGDYASKKKLAELLGGLG